MIPGNSFDFEPIKDEPFEPEAATIPDEPPKPELSAHDAAIARIQKRRADNAAAKSASQED
jgi:hypothetical protein